MEKSGVDGWSFRPFPDFRFEHRRAKRVQAPIVLQFFMSLFSRCLSLFLAVLL